MVMFPREVIERFGIRYSPDDREFARPRRVVSVDVSVPLPKAVKARSVVFQRSNVEMYDDRYRRFSLAPVSVGDYRMARVRVKVPVFKERSGVAGWSATRSGVSVNSLESLRRGMRPGPLSEWNRLRRGERKEKRFKYRHGQVESMRSDPHGMLSAAMALGLSPARIADTAMVSRALTRR